jgi:hypothetical protein
MQELTQTLCTEVNLTESSAKDRRLHVEIAGIVHGVLLSPLLPDQFPGQSAILPEHLEQHVPKPATKSM